eukprot:comp15834_c0_seq1/m.13154 comp15834_c0_seq1/g.13154  ORF comp15834_c0_seq1/g.13154 comp15834_c0_seq1/m.13154 type:complete len:838 (-) comp15834_c0_seq1:122-2635(-)
MGDSRGPRFCLLGFLVLSLSCVCHAVVIETHPDYLSGAVGLVRRLLGAQNAARFRIEILPPVPTGFGTYEIESAKTATPSVFSKSRNSDGFGNNQNIDAAEVVLRGTSPVEVASALKQYLSEFLNMSISWVGDNMLLPDGSFPYPLPVPSTVIVKRRYQRFSYYQNVCTSSYSMVWWDWARWERELDWMATRGINFALAFVGQEAVWHHVFTTVFNLCPEEVMADYFTGPAFLAWNRMGNLQRWGGPLPQSFLDGQLALQKTILARMAELSITPILPGFSGHVPAAITRVSPQANVTLSSRWVSFNDTFTRVSYVEPTDPLFVRIGVEYMKAQQQLFGVGGGGYYNIDQFNEMNPRSGDLAYLARCSQAVLDSLKMVDPEAVWVLQGWLFQNAASFWTLDRIEAYLSPVPNPRMIILDLWAEHTPIWSRTLSFFGKPFIWCQLHNFGGNQAIYGALDVIRSAPYFAAKSAPNMVGVGITMEAINQNPIVYDALLDMVWDQQPKPLDAWVDTWVLARYGTGAGSGSQVRQAWQALVTEAYAGRTTIPPRLFDRRPSLANMNELWAMQGDVGGHSAYAEANARHGLRRRSLLTSFTSPPRPLKLTPQLLSDTVIAFPTTWKEMWSDGSYEEAIWTAWGLLVQAMHAEDLASVEPFRYDLVDVTRQVLVNAFAGCHASLVAAYSNGTVGDVRSWGAWLVEIVDDLDSLLATNKHTMLGTWLHGARSLATSDEEADVYEFNARNQITLWGPRGEINDYAAKQWAGLVGSYYRKRWKMFVDHLDQSLQNGAAFNQSEFDAKCLEFEISWGQARDSFPIVPVGDTIKVVADLYVKYAGAVPFM